MASVERGKGKRRQTIEITQHGPVLRSQEIDAGDTRLPGYRRCRDEAAARAALVAEVRAHLADGMQPADDDARAIAAVEASAPAASAALPLRVDLGIYNEATGFVVTSRRMAGKTLDEGSAEWKKAVGRGDMLPLTLVQDDSFVIRVVAGAPLSSQEAEEWVARVDWHLNIPDGKLCVTGGSVFTNEDYDEDDPYAEQFVGQALLPKGRYRAALYSHPYGVNGDRDGNPPDDRERVDFLLHLEPIGEVPKTGLSALPDDGWFSGAENRRTRSSTPAGLVAADVVRRREDAPGGWTYVREASGTMPAVESSPVTGDAVSLPVDSIGRAARIAWFGSRFIAVDLRLTAPAGLRLDLSGDWPAGVVLVEADGAGRILFDSDIDVSQLLQRLPELAGLLNAQPAGTLLDLNCEPVQEWAGSPDGAGRLALRGELRGGIWRVEAAYPEVDAATLHAALALAAEVEGQTIAAHDASERDAILGWARRKFGAHLKRNPPKPGVDGIRFARPGHEVALLGIAAFTHRFAGTWPVAPLHDMDEDG